MPNDPQSHEKAKIERESRSLTLKILFFVIVVPALLVIVYKSIDAASSSKPPESFSDGSYDAGLQLRIMEAEREKRISEATSEKKEVVDKAEETKWFKTKAGKIQKRHPEWSREDCENLANGKIWIGMHVDMLKYRRGLPDAANPSNYGNGTRWQWCWNDYTPSCYYDNNDDGLIDSYN